MHLYQAGLPLPTISEWLGHSNIEMSRFYVKVTEAMKKEAPHKLSDSDSSVFKDDVVFKYANDEDTIEINADSLLPCLTSGQAWDLIENLSAFLKYRPYAHIAGKDLQR